MTPDTGRNERSRSERGGDELLQLVVADLEELQAGDVEILDVRELTDVTDYMVVATGRTNRHVRAITDTVVVSAKHRDAPPIGVEGEREGDWVLVDLGDVVVHVMRPEARELYQLEKLWSPIVALREQTGTPVT
jgi:ribosome-associated protein